MAAVVTSLSSDRPAGDPEQLSAYERWELPNIEAGPADGEGATLQPVTAEALEDIQQQARKEGFEQGHQEGFEKGFLDGRSEVEQRLQELDSILRDLTEPLAELDEAVIEQTAELAMAVAGHLVRRELRTAPEEVVAVVREALSALPVGSRQVKVFLHPADAELVRSAFSVHDDEEALNWKIVEEPLLSRGGCKVSASNSSIDASVEQRLNRIIAAVLGGQRAGDRADGE